MADILNTISTRQTPQSRKADPRQVRNAAGGYTFQVGDWERLHRFLTLGTEGGTYYTSARELTEQNAAVVFRCAASDPVRLVQEIVDISTAGRAPRQNPGIFALAIAASVDNHAQNVSLPSDGRRAALAAVPKVCRTGYTLFLFANYAKQFRGWGRGMRQAVSGWYLDKPVDRLVYQALKYRQREGYTHRDCLRLSHPKADVPDRAALFDWICGRDLGEFGPGDNLALVEDFNAVQGTENSSNWVAILQRGHGMSWEMLPDAAMNERKVWEALLEQGIPPTALMRQLPRLTNLGMATNSTGRKIAEQLKDPERLKRGRIHPINVLVAQRTYAQGHGEKGKLSWQPSRMITDALDEAFYAAYGAVEPANKRTLLALDISGSMGSKVSGLPISCREACAAIAMVTAATEPSYEIVGFTSAPGHNYRSWREATQLQTLDISPRRRLDDICRYTAALPMGGTDVSLPMVWAFENRLDFDTFIILTDNETWAGPKCHPHQALSAYRQRSGIDARMIVVAMTATGNTVADPSDPRQIDVSGFDSTVPQLISDFSRGDI
jgi:60 kDa SS-A/Ro ribonucleoprotein